MYNSEGIIVKYLDHLVSMKLEVRISSSVFQKKKIKKLKYFFSILFIKKRIQRVAEVLNVISFEHME